MDVCISYTDCEGITFDLANHDCALFLKKVELTHKIDRIYIDMENTNKLKPNNPCYGRPCGPGKRCIPDRVTHICVTPDSFASMYLIHGKCAVPEANIVASSGVVPSKFGLIGDHWCAESKQKNEWIQVRFESEKVVKELITRGGRYDGSWVETFSIEYSIDCVNFRYVRNSTKEYQEFDGNMDKSTYKHNVIQYRFKALCMRIRPLSWHRKICMRMEVIGCEP